MNLFQIKFGKNYIKFLNNIKSCNILIVHHYFLDFSYLISLIKNSFNNHNIRFMSNKEKAKLVIRYSQEITFDIVINALKIVLIALYDMQI